MNPTGFADQTAPDSLPKGWTWAALAEIARINPALDVRITDDARQVSFVPMAAVDEGFGGVQRPQVRDFGQVKKGYTPFQMDDVIMAKITPCMENGKGGVIRGKPGEVFFGSTEFHVLRARTGVLPAWIGSFLAQERIRRAARLGMQGSAGQLRVPQEFLERLHLPLPPSAEQQRIADRIDELFTDLAAGVAALKRVRRNLSRYRAAVLHSAVTGRLTEAWRKQHGPPEEPGSKLLERILVERRRQWEKRTLAKYEAKGKEPPKNWRDRYPEPAPPKPSADGSPLPPLPEGWCWASMDQLFSTVRNGTAIVPRADQGIPILRISAVRPLRVDLEDVRHLTETEAQRADAWVEGGDLFFTRYNGSTRLCGVCGRVVECDFPLVHPDKLIKCRVVDGLVNGEFVEIAANSGHSRATIESRLRTTAGQVGVSGTDVKNTPIPMPPLDEQSTIVEAVNEKLSQIDALEAEVERGLARASRLRQAILKAAFEGKLVPQDPTDEPASVLLRRISKEATTQAASGYRDNGAVRRKRAQPIRPVAKARQVARALNARCAERKRRR